MTNDRKPKSDIAPDDDAGIEQPTQADELAEAQREWAVYPRAGMAERTHRQATNEDTERVGEGGE